MRATVDISLATRAKAGDKRAINQLLAETKPYVRKAVRLALRRARVSFDVFDDALAAGMEIAWDSIATWDPERAPLHVYCWDLVLFRAVMVARALGHSTYLPQNEPDDSRGSYRRAQKPAIMLDAPTGDNEEAPPLRELLPARSVSPIVLHDLTRVLDNLDFRERSALMRIAQGERFQDVAEDFGCSRQRVEQIHQAAMARARKVANRRNVA